MERTGCQDVSVGVIRPQAVSNIEAPLPAIIVGYAGLLWGSLGVLFVRLVPHSAPARLCAQLSPLFLGYNGAKWHPAVE